jgi:hypothetical protein
MTAIRASDIDDYYDEKLGEQAEELGNRFLPHTSDWKSREETNKVDEND